MKFFNTLIAVAITVSSPEIAHAATLELKNVYANVEIIPEDRTDVTVDVRRSDGRLPLPKLTRSGGDVLVDGGIRYSNSCMGVHPDSSISLFGFGRRSRASTINITVHTPRDVHVNSNGSIIGNIRPSGNIDLITAGCSQWRIADVGGTLSIHQDGVATIKTGASAAARLELSGVSHIDLAATRALTVDMSGMGNVRLQSISGPVDASLSGMGNVKIAGGRADHVKADVSGMGGFSLSGSASTLDADVSGVGGVHVDHVYGAVHKSVSGIGRVSVGG